MAEGPILQPGRLTKHVKLIQKIAFILEDRLLVLKRPDTEDSRPGCWDLPGGNAEWPGPEDDFNHGGLHKEELAREVREEIGLSVAPIQFNHRKLIHFDTYYEADKKRYSIISGWKFCLPEGFEPDVITLSEEHTEYRWVNFVELQSLDFGQDEDGFLWKIMDLSMAEFMDD